MKKTAKTDALLALFAAMACTVDMHTRTAGPFANLTVTTCEVSKSYCYIRGIHQIVKTGEKKHDGLFMG